MERPNVIFETGYQTVQVDLSEMPHFTQPRAVVEEIRGNVKNEMVKVQPVDIQLQDPYVEETSPIQLKQEVTDVEVASDISIDEEGLDEQNKGVEVVTYDPYILERINDHMRIYRCRKCPKFYYNLTSFSDHYGIHSESAFVCDFCGERFSRKTSLRAHIHSLHLDIKPHKCSKCPELFSCKSALFTHMKTSHGVKRINCDVCKKSFRSVFLLNLHKDSHKLRCDFCFKEFRTQEKMLEHIEDTHVGLDTRARTYVCDLCPRSYNSSNSLISHRRVHTDRAYICDFCKRHFMGKFALSEHITSVHLRVKPYKCSYCKLRFGQKTRLTIHERKHTGQKTRKCKICSKQFTVLSLLKKHVLTHVDKKPHLCPYCPMTTRDPSNLEKHIQRKHGMGEDFTVIFTCDLCQHNFATKTKLACHMFVHTNVHPFQCSVCLRVFNSAASLRYHAKRHNPNAMFTCPICGKSCWDKYNHMKTHHDERPFACPDCGKSFRSKNHVELHRRVHTGERPFQCEICSKTFSFRSNLNAHHKMHTGEKRYICTNCGKAFPYQSGLRRHVVVGVCQNKSKVEILVPTLLRPKTLSNPYLNPVDPNKKIYECTRCQKEFYHKSSFNRHNKICQLRYDIDAQEDGHARHKFKCDTCGRCYKNRSSLSMHRRMHMKKFIVCGICSKPFIRKSHYREHMMSKHSMVKPFSCGYCKVSYHLKHILQRHIRKAHGPDADANHFETFVEEGNSYAYDLTTEIISNYLDTGDNKPFKCKICSRSYKSKASYDKHAAIHLNKALSCGDCGKLFTQKKQLDEHVQKEHPKAPQRVQVVVEPEKRYKCVYCDHIYAKKEDCDHHMETHWSISTGSGAIYATNSTMNTDGTIVHNLTVPSSLHSNSSLQAVSMQDGSMSMHSPMQLVSNMQSPAQSNIIHASTSHLQPVHVTNCVMGDTIVPAYAYNTFTPNKVPAYTLQRTYNWDDPNEEQLVTYEAIPLEEPEPISLDAEPTEVLFLIDNTAAEEVPPPPPPPPKVKAEKPPERLKTFKCDQCRRCYTTEKNLNTHKVSHSLETINCVFCEKAFQPKLLRTHVKTVHMSERMLKCPICGEFFPKKRLLDDHLKTHTEAELNGLVDPEPPPLRMIGVDGLITVPPLKRRHRKSTRPVIDKPYKCQDCGKSYYTRTSLCTHRRIHTGRALCCVFCQKQFIKKHQLKDHVTAVHMKLKNYRCTVCPETFARRLSLQKHMRSHEPKADPEPGSNPAKPFKCPECVKCFASKNYMMEHMKLHTGEAYSCEVCNKMFTKTKALREHIMAVHTHIQPYKCEFCQKCFTQKSNFNLHRRKHTGEKLRKCSFCSKLFTSEAPLVRHMRTHTGFKPYPCEICEKSFSDQSNLKKHILIHVGGKRFQCGECGLSYNVKKSYDEHVLTHNPNYKPTSLTCEECGKVFAQKYRFEAHRKMHERDSKKPFVCEICGKRWMSLASIERHMRHHLTVKTLICAICNKSFETKNRITKHMSVHFKSVSGDAEIKTNMNT